MVSPANAFSVDLFPFPRRGAGFEEVFRAATGMHPLPLPIEILAREAVHGAVDAIIRSRGPGYIRQLDRYRLNTAGAVDYSPATRTKVWEFEPEFFLAEWAMEDPLILGVRPGGVWRWVLFLNRTAPEVVDLTMYLALAPYPVGLAPLARPLRECGIEEATAIIPKAVGAGYLDRHRAAGFTVTGEDDWSLFVGCRLEDAR